MTARDEMAKKLNVEIPQDMDDLLQQLNLGCMNPDWGSVVGQLPSTRSVN